MNDFKDELSMQNQKLLDLLDHSSLKKSIKGALSNSDSIKFPIPSHFPCIGNT